MPTYVYECRTCEKVFEVEQRITEDPITDCDCGARGSVIRVIQPVGIAFKGSGFYVNDATGGATTSASSASETPAEPASSAPAEASPAPAPDTGSASS